MWRCRQSDWLSIQNCFECRLGRIAPGREQIDRSTARSRSRRSPRLLSSSPSRIRLPCGRPRPGGFGSVSPFSSATFRHISAVSPVLASRAATMALPAYFLRQRIEIVFDLPAARTKRAPKCQHHGHRFFESCQPMQLGDLPLGPADRLPKLRHSLADRNRHARHKWRKSCARYLTLFLLVSRDKPDAVTLVPRTSR